MNVVWTYKEQTTYVPCFFECVYIEMCRFVINNADIVRTKREGNCYVQKTGLKTGDTPRIKHHYNKKNKVNPLI